MGQAKRRGSLDERIAQAEARVTAPSPIDGIRCKLCKTCPFLPGNERLGWEHGSRTTLVNGLQHPSWYMECHTVPWSACAGFVACLGHESRGVRTALSRGRLQPSAQKPIRGAVRSFAELDALCQGAENWT